MVKNGISYKSIDIISLKKMDSDNNNYEVLYCPKMMIIEFIEINVINFA